jgi:regulator of telomere elongation helicase 1
MTTLMKALQGGQNALLESPTGTGKTLALLCASLAFLKQAKDSAFVPQAGKATGTDANETCQIIYASRTHTQLLQVQKELKRTAYRPTSIIVGSRDKLCVSMYAKNEAPFNKKAAD